MNVANPRHVPALIPRVLAISIFGMSQASAGMTVVTLTDIARARLDALSFFLVSYLAICWVVKLLWNYLGKTFTILPKLNYTRALGLVMRRDKHLSRGLREMVAALKGLSER